MTRPIMHFTRYISWLLASALVTLPLTTFAANEDVTGLWLAKKKDIAVRIKQCGSEGLCGYMAWLSPEEAARKPELCGVKVLWNVQPVAGSSGKWARGTLLKADENKHYGADLEMIDASTIDLRAYIGVPLFGKTKRFTRTTESTHPPCIVKTQN
jgi:uncharacterized protein (DUF2147 family)